MNKHIAAVALFEPEYGDSRSAEELATERPKVRARADELEGLNGNREHWQERIDRMRDRRADRDDIQPFENLRAHDPDVVVASDALIVRDDPAKVQELAEAFDLEIRPIPGADDRIVQLVDRDRRKSKLCGRIGEVVEGARGRSINVWPSYVASAGVIHKAEGGVEPTAGSRPFPSVEMTGSGAPIVVAVIDTGISTQQRTDGYLQGLERPQVDNIDELDVFPRPQRLDAAAGHGTFAAGIVQQVAPQATLMVRKALDSDGYCTDVKLAQEMTRAVSDDQAKILNLSLGTVSLDDQPPIVLESALRTIIAQDPDVLVVAAAGNYGTDRPVWPAAFHTMFPDNVVSVAGLDPDGLPAGWSTHGTWVECSAIGQGVVSTYVAGREDEDLDPTEPDEFGDDAWASWTGTSFAAPQIAGAVARRCQEDNQLTPREALDQLLAGAPQDPQQRFGTMVRVLPGT